MANCIRYIINFSGQRVQNKKSSIKVLEVQPNKGSELNKDEVRKWFPGNTFPSDSAIDITTMSTAEFIGKIEDINEIYDLVYIGASLEGFHTVGSGSGQTTAYNDTAMNGLIYSNIGDRYVSQISLAGLLDRDYSSSTFTQGGDVYNKIANNTTTKTFRFSGNDITATKQEKFLDFAASGFPVIVSDTLISTGQAARPQATLSANASASVSGSRVTLHAAASTTASVEGETSYIWYRGTTPVWYDSDYTFTPTGAGSYTCKATMTVDGVSYTATSDRIALKSGGWSVTESGSSNSGIVPWNLEVVKVGSEHIHNSEHGYTYIKPSAPTKLNILQVMSAQNLNLATNSTYNSLYDQVDDVYDINVTPISIQTLNSFQANSPAYGGHASMADYLDSFDMLIMGFGDMYGSLSQSAANAVVDYIDSGKAILFTHDTTSFVNLPFNNYQTTSGSISYSYWGYYFNTVLRDSVGLDRYGVTNSTYGVTRYSPQRSSGTGIVTNGYAGLDETTKTALRSAGYSIAYEPGSNFVPTGETQGYAKHTLVRYTAGTGSNTYLYPTDDSNYTTSGSNNTTKKVSQVNEGQITTFPFNLNTQGFGNAATSSTTLSVAETHDQYYQLNMNSDDIVVWYCLSGTNFSSPTNDVTNAYYIYNRGNVTYSGAGHTTGTVAVDEAKLFVNTMIAAYRAGVENPTVSFRSTAGDDMEYFFLPAEYNSAETYQGTILTGADAASEERAVAFVISDPNLASNKSVSVKLYYQDEAGESLQLGDGTSVQASQLQNVRLYRSNGTESGTENLSSNVLYTFYLSDSLLEAFGSRDSASINLYVQVSTSIGKSIYYGYDVLELRKLGLLNLR